ncbi:M23 family metallopeptidase [Microbacterium sp. 1P10UB]|uniref:M23 family metallopeptidase n=1 Tax=unclassified Microbacterium TaxID=2609290 RepID=UPI0039A3BE12
MRSIRSRRSRIASAAGAALAAALLLSACTAPTAPVASSSPTPTSAPGAPAVADGEDLTPDIAFTALIAQPTTVPAPVLASDGKVHLAYELLLTNAAPITYAVSALEVLDPDSGDTLLTIGPDVIQRAITRLGASSEGVDATGPVEIGSAQTWIAWIDVAVDPDKVPTRLQHRTEGEVVRPDGAVQSAPYLLTTVAVSDEQAAVVGSPVAAGDWYMSEGCCSNYTHHRNGFLPVNGVGLAPQRFAIDFFKVDENGKTWEGDPSQLSSYFSYRQPIVAAASGTVVRAVDVFENTDAAPEPPTVPPIIETVGNHVVVEIAPGRYLLYGHMDPGSVKVKVGDTVEAGQELGLIGSSGNSTTPHLHFQLQTEPTFFPTDSVPYVFDSFTLLGSVPDRIWDDDLGLQPTGQLPFDKIDPSDRKNELPLDRTVVRLG